MSTAGIWATYPKDFLTNFPGGFVDQVVGTAMLMMVVLAIGDPRNLAVPVSVAPFVVGAAVTVIGMTYGLNAGYAINPARDFGPRLFTYLAGWGDQVFKRTTTGGGCRSPARCAAPCWAGGFMTC